MTFLAKLPDLSTLKAFTVRGNQAVTYARGVWHAPMVVTKGTINFAVLISENGVPSEDCVENYYDPPLKIYYNLGEAERSGVSL